MEESPDQQGESEFTIDPNSTDANIDELNDDTFGDIGPLTDEWEKQQSAAADAVEQHKDLLLSQKKEKPPQLPTFFQEFQPLDNFHLEEEPLEPESQSHPLHPERTIPGINKDRDEEKTPRRVGETSFPTSHQLKFSQRQDDFFFSGGLEEELPLEDESLSYREQETMIIKSLLKESEDSHMIHHLPQLQHQLRPQLQPQPHASTTTPQPYSPRQVGVRVSPYPLPQQQQQQQIALQQQLQDMTLSGPSRPQFQLHPSLQSQVQVHSQQTEPMYSNLQPNLNLRPHVQAPQTADTQVQAQLRAEDNSVLAKFFGGQLPTSASQSTSAGAGGGSLNVPALSVQQLEARLKQPLSQGQPQQTQPQVGYSHAHAHAPASYLPPFPPSFQPQPQSQSQPQPQPQFTPSYAQQQLQLQQSHIQPEARPRPVLYSTNPNARPSPSPSQYQHGMTMNSPYSPHDISSHSPGGQHTVYQPKQHPSHSPIPAPVQSSSVPSQVPSTLNSQLINTNREESEPLFTPDQFPVLSRETMAMNPQPQRSPATPQVLVRREKESNGTISSSGNSNSGSGYVNFNRESDRDRRYSHGNQEKYSHAPQVQSKWQGEPKKMMSNYEIDSIIRMQEMQLQQTGNNLFAEDFYYVMNKVAAPTSPSLHKPLYESNTKSVVFRRPVDLMEGVLGRIPSHSVRAPRPLLQLKSITSNNPSSTSPAASNLDSNANENSNQNNVDFEQSQDPADRSSKIIQSLLLTIENCFNLLIDIEDIDRILRATEKSGGTQTGAFVNVFQISQKRNELSQELFKCLQVYTLQYPNILPTNAPLQDNDTQIYGEDEMFVSLSLISKGRKLISRCIPMLYADHVNAVFMVYMRNLAAIAASPRIEWDTSGSSKVLFSILGDYITSANVSQTILSLQTVIAAHQNDLYLFKILHSKFGLGIIQHLLKRGHDLNLSPFSREDVLPMEVQTSQIAAAGYHWREVVHQLSQRLLGKLSVLFNSEIGQSNKIWEFFAVLVVNINASDKRQLIAELREKVLATPLNQTLAAFLHLAGAHDILQILQVNPTNTSFQTANSTLSFAPTTTVI